MTQRQHDSPTSGRTSRLILTSFEVDRGKWEQFGALAKSQNRSRGAQIRELIDRALDQHDTEEAAA